MKEARGGMWMKYVGAFGLLLLLVGSYIGLFVAPAERHMGDVARIMYVHVPTAWVAMVCYTIAFGLAIVSLWKETAVSDARMTGAIETGVVLNGLLLLQGMIWGRPTWGVWWDWDVRLTTSLVMFLLFAGVLALRSFVDDARRRAAWSAVATIVAFVDVPLVYFCVRWWRSLHQVQSTPSTVDPMMVIPLRINAFAVLFVALWMIHMRKRIELARRKREETDLPERLAVQEGEANA
ncbi:MAG: cytochrome c biogenesis protein [Acidobacteriota bacterium]|nr:cytochrome c biogenesis protein [Acidobacteriota bacterium]